MIGFGATAASDLITNIFHVIRVLKQNAMTESYKGIFSKIIEENSFKEVMLRGLTAKLFGNAIQGAIFSLAYNHINERIGIKSHQTN